MCRLFSSCIKPVAWKGGLFNTDRDIRMEINKYDIMLFPTEILGYLYFVWEAYG